MSVELDRLGPWMQPYLGPAGTCRLNLGCGRNGWPEWINLDRVMQPSVDIVCDLEQGHLPFEDQAVTCIVACHVLEHITHLVPLMRECARVLQDGGHLIAITPHAASDDAWEDPTHVRAFTDKSWIYFDKRLYEQEGLACAYDAGIDFILELVSVVLIPQPQWLEAAKTSPDQLADERYRYRNVIKEVRAVLRKVAV